MDAFTVALDLLNKGGTLAVVLGIAFAVWRKELVLGWQYREKESELETCKVVAEAYQTKIEAKLERLEAERDRRDVPAS